MTRAVWEAERQARKAGYRSLADLVIAEAKRRRAEKLDYLFATPKNA